MIVDFRSGIAPDGYPLHWDLVDLDTGLHVPGKVFFADDETGEYRVYLTDEHGNYRTSLNYDSTRGTDGLVIEIRHGRIKVVPRAESPRLTGRPYREPTWRDRGPLL